MKSFNKNYIVIISLLLSQISFSQGVRQIGPNLYSESEIIDSNGVIYSTVISGKFNANVLNTNKSELLLNVIDNRFIKIKNKLEYLKNKYGDFRIIKKIPEAIWGDTIRVNKRTGKNVSVPDLSQMFSLKFARLVPVDSIITELKDIDYVKYIKKPVIIQMFAEPNDPLYDNQWYLDVVNSENAWDINKGVSNITIAIIDAGIEEDHPDLEDKIVGSSGTAFYNEHGTFVAGVAGASTDNLIGIASLGWNLTLYDYDMDVVTPEVAIYDAANTSDVINMSWGIFRPATLDDMPPTCGNPSKWVPWASVPFPDPDIHDALEYAIAQGIVCVASAGNTSVNSNPLTGVPSECDPAPIPYDNYPAAFNNIIAVSATELNGSIEEFVDDWNYSPSNWMDLSAPGKNILTTDPYVGYTSVNGTSFSSPLTAALCGLILSVNNSLTINQVYNTLVSTADKIGQYSYNSGWNRYMGYGRINAYKALQALVTPPAIPQNFQITKVTLGSNYRPKLTWNANTEPTLAGYVIERKIDDGPWEIPITGYLSKEATSFIDYEIVIWNNSNFQTAYYRMRAYNYLDVYSDYTQVKSIDFHIMLKPQTTQEAVTMDYALINNIPNPFNPSTIIKYTLKEPGIVKINVYNILGSKVAELVNESKKAGYHSVEFNASNLPSGVYVYTLQVNGYFASKKMLLLK